MGTGAWEKLTLVRDPTFRVSTDTQPDSGPGDSAVSGGSAQGKNQWCLGAGSHVQGQAAVC